MEGNPFLSAAITRVHQSDTFDVRGNWKPAGFMMTSGSSRASIRA